MIRSKGITLGTEPLFLFTRDALLKVHPAYRDAKAGDEKAALELVLDLAVAWLYVHRERFAPGLLFVAPHAQEATGDNAIPQTLAAVCATIYRGHVDTEIVQSDRVYHTGADPMERMVARAQFEGLVIPGAEYVLVDDVTNLGGELWQNWPASSKFLEALSGTYSFWLTRGGTQHSFPPESSFN